MNPSPVTDTISIILPTTDYYIFLSLDMGEHTEPFFWDVLSSLGKIPDFFAIVVG